MVQIFDNGSEKGHMLKTILKGELIIEYAGAAIYKKNLKQLKQGIRKVG